MLDQVTLQTIYRLTPQPSLVFLPDAPVFTIVDVNQSYTEKAAVSREELLGASFFEYFSRFSGKDMTDDRDALERLLKDKVSTETSINRYEFPDTTQQKTSTRYFKAINVPILDGNNNIKYILHTVAEETQVLAVQQEQQLAQKRLTEATLLMNQGQELANFGSWQWDINENVVTWSDTLFAIYGLDKKLFKATFEGYLELIHPEDRARIYNLVLNMQQSGSDAVFEERIIRPNGEIRYLRSWGKVLTNEDNIPVKMIGACLDITDSKLTEEKLRVHITAIERQNKHLQDISWIQSHVVRAPLARVLGLIEVFRTCSADDLDKHDVLDKITASATELDNVIKDISARTENVNTLL